MQEIITPGKNVRHCSFNVLSERDFLYSGNVRGQRYQFLKGRKVIFSTYYVMMQLVYKNFAAAIKPVLVGDWTT